MICEKCGKEEHADRQNVGTLPVGWSKVYLTVKRQKKSSTDIRSRASVMFRQSIVFCADCSEQRIYSRFVDQERQQLEFTVKL